MIFESLSLLKFDHLNIKLGEWSDVPTSTWNVSTQWRESGKCACHNFYKGASHVHNIPYCETSKLKEYSEGLVDKIRK